MDPASTLVTILAALGILIVIALAVLPALVERLDS